MPGIPLATMDARRVIYEVNDPEKNISVQYFEILQSVPLGNHFHTKKYEVFTILAGRCVLMTARINPDIGIPFIGMARSPILLTAGSVVKVWPFEAHAFVMEFGSRMICVSSAAFNKDNPDITPCELMNEDQGKKYLRSFIDASSLHNPV